MVIGARRSRPRPHARTGTPGRMAERTLLRPMRSPPRCGRNEKDHQERKGRTHETDDPDARLGRRSCTMTKVVALMSMSLDGYVADANDGVAEVFDWYFSGDVEIPMPSPSSDMTFRVSAPSADHVKGLMAEVGAMLTGRRTFERADGWGGQHPWNIPAFVATHHVPDGWPRPGSTVQFVTDGIASAVARAKSAAGPKSVGVHGAQTIQQCLDAGLLEEIHIDLAAVLLGAGVRL